MTTREERIKEIIIAKEEKVKEMQMRQGIRSIRSALIHVRRGQTELEFAGVHMRAAKMTEMSDAVEKARRLLSEALSELIRYDR